MESRKFSAEEIKKLQAAERIYTFLYESDANNELVRMVVKDLTIEELKVLVDTGSLLWHDVYSKEMERVLSEKIIASVEFTINKLENALDEDVFNSLIERLGRKFFDDLKNNLRYIKDANTVVRYERLISKVLDELSQSCCGKENTAKTM